MPVETANKRGGLCRFFAEQRNPICAPVDRTKLTAVLFDGSHFIDHTGRRSGLSLWRAVFAVRRIKKGDNFMNTRNEIKAYIIREGKTMSEVVEKLAEEHGWSASVPNLSGKLRRGSLRYREAVELADVLGYEIVWQKRK